MAPPPAVVVPYEWRRGVYHSASSGNGVMRCGPRVTHLTPFPSAAEPLRRSMARDTAHTICPIVQCTSTGCSAHRWTHRSIFPARAHCRCRLSVSIYDETVVIFCPSCTPLERCESTREDADQAGGANNTTLTIGALASRPSRSPFGLSSVVGGVEWGLFSTLTMWGKRKEERECVKLVAKKEVG